MPTERESHIVRLFTLSGVEPERIQIQHVQPQVDCGRYPVKACLGDTVTVSATIFRDGYDKLEGVVRFRPVGTRRWREAPLEPLGNDYFEAGIAPDALGPWELRIQAWVDPYASWLDEHDRKVAAGQVDLSGELSEGRALFGDGTVDEWRFAAQALSHRKRKGAVKSAVLRIDVDRERARFGSWYELFPRSWGGFRGVAAVLPDLAALGFDIVYLPPVHPIGETHRKGRNNTERARKGDPGSPWAIGGDGGRPRRARIPTSAATPTSTRWSAAAREAGIELALDFAIQTSPDHPWLREHPEWFHRRPDGTLKYAENPPKRYQDIHNVDWDTSEREALWNALQGRRPRLVRPRHPRLPGRQPPHEADAVLGVADRRGACRLPGGDLPGRGVHAPGADDDARQDRLLAVVHLLRVEEHEGRARRVRRAGAVVVGVLPPEHVAEHARHPQRVPPARRPAGVRGATRPRRDALAELRDLLWLRGLRERAGARGERGVPRLGEVRGQEAQPRRAAAAADPARERDPPRASCAAALREPDAGSKPTATI